ncbi:MAG: DNRLRE domain-containing protein [Phycisphaerae bacterium]
MSHDKSPHFAAIVLVILGITATRATAEHAQTTLKYNPGQPGHTNTYDTYINLDAPGTNYNGYWYGHITRENDNPNDPPEKSTLVRFDLPDWVYDSSVTIHSAELGLWVYQLVDLDTSNDWVYVGAYRINANRDWVDSQATWNVFKGSSYWATPGCEHVPFDRVGTADDTLTFTKYSAINRYYEWTVTSSVNIWKGGAANRGWIMRVPSYDGGPEEGISVELTESSAAHRPKLWLDWTQTPVADADGPYSCAYLGSVTLNGGGSYERDAGSLVQWAWDLNLDGNYTDVYGVGPSVSWDYLVNTLGLTPGQSHTIGLKVFDDDGEWSTAAYSSLFIAVPEPGMLGLLALGGVAMIRRRRS